MDMINHLASIGLSDQTKRVHDRADELALDLGIPQDFARAMAFEEAYLEKMRQGA